MLGIRFRAPIPTGSDRLLGAICCLHFVVADAVLDVAIRFEGRQVLHPLLWRTINALPNLRDDQIVAGGPLALASPRFPGCAGHAKDLLSCGAHCPFALARCDEPIGVRHLYLGRLSRGGRASRCS
jgi:hypothetical protein